MMIFFKKKLNKRVFGDDLNYEILKTVLKISHNTDNEVEISLFYGKEIFEILFCRTDIRNEFLSQFEKKQN